MLEKHTHIYIYIYTHTHTLEEKKLYFIPKQKMSKTVQPEGYLEVY